MKIYGILWTESYDNAVIVTQSRWAFKYRTTAENHIKEAEKGNKNRKGKIIEILVDELPY